jgi:hypothetical protein
MAEQKLEAIIRKFVPRRGMVPGGTRADYVNIPGGHPDFEFEEARRLGQVKGIVKSTLRKNEEDGLFKPQYSGQSQGTVSSEASFNQWFTTYGISDTSYGNSEQKIILPLKEKAGQPGVLNTVPKLFFRWMMKVFLLQLTRDDLKLHGSTQMALSGDVPRLLQGALLSKQHLWMRMVER